MVSAKQIAPPALQLSHKIENNCKSRPQRKCQIKCELLAVLSSLPILNLLGKLSVTDFPAFSLDFFMAKYASTHANESQVNSIKSPTKSTAAVIYCVKLKLFAFILALFR